MIIGIILAMVFSSSVIISIFSLHASTLEMGKNAIGIQDVIILDATKDAVAEAVKDGYIEEYGYAHMLGFASTTDEKKENGFYIAWLDETAKKLSYQSFIEGSYPTNDNEIAIEKSAMARLGIDAKIGDEISLEVFPQNKLGYIESSNQKTYKLVGIAEDKALAIEDREYMKGIPAAFVCEGTETDAGGKECLAAYLTFADFEYPKYVEDGDYVFRNTKNNAFFDYINNKYFLNGGIYASNTDDSVLTIINTDYSDFYFNNSSLETSIEYMCIISIVLALTACIAIINSFNSNIKERRQQIGMLRAVGTTKKQIRKILGREAIIISLLSIPISLVLSYLFVLVLSNLFGKDFVLKVDILSIVACGVVGFITVMLAALIPIIHATRITPMQAIRNVNVARKMKIKKIKTQKDFSVPKLLAKRSMAFHKGNQIAVSVLLVSTILFSCVGFSYVQYENEHPYTYGYDFHIDCSYATSSEMYNSLDYNQITDIDKQNICAAPYVSEAFGIKKVNANILVDEYTDYFKVVADDTAVYDIDDDPYTTTFENYVEKNRSNFSDYYYNIRKIVGYQKDFLPSAVYGIDDWQVETFKDNLVAGEINLDKLASGEEVILVAPEKAALVYDEFKDIVYTRLRCDEDVKGEDESEFLLYGESEYKVGDTIDLSLVFGDPDTDPYTSDFKDNGFKAVNKQVKIGAIIKPSYFEYSDTYWNMLHGSKVVLLTTVAGVNHFDKNAEFQNIYMFVNGEMNDEINEAVKSAVDPILYKYDRSIDSAYDFIQRHENESRSMLVAMVSIIIIGFAICASLTNNVYTASIRERKRELGTLRAVGISQKEFFNSYIIQLLKTFGFGYGLGFGLFVSLYLICHIIVFFKNEANSFFDSEVTIAFNPWITIGFCIILFAICSINLWSKIKKEMKNSIIDNIREL